MTKNSNFLISPFFEVVYTQKELEFLLLELKKLNETLGKTSVKKITTAFKQLASDFLAPMQDSWKTYQASEDAGDISSFIQRLEEDFLNLEKIQLHLAYKPSQAQAELICSWLRNKFKNNEIIIDTKFDSKVVAGCILEYQGKRYDLSVASKLSNYVQ